MVEAKERDLWAFYKGRKWTERDWNISGSPAVSTSCTEGTPPRAGWASVPSAARTEAGPRGEAQAARRSPAGHKHNPSYSLWPLLSFFSPSSSRLAGRASGPAADVTKNSSASFGCEGAPLTYRVSEAWQVAVGVCDPSKLERSDSPIHVPTQLQPKSQVHHALPSLSLSISGTPP